jgi:hypothetical protein
LLWPDKHGDRIIGSLSPDRCRWLFPNGGYSDVGYRITHWQPLPKPPRKAAEKRG